MLKGILKLGILLVAVILIWNLVFGNDQEKQNSRKIFGEMRDVVVSVADLVKAEKTKFDAGKYDAALAKLGGAYKFIREKTKNVDASIIDRLNALDQKKMELQQEVNAIEQEDRQLNTPAPTPKKGVKTDPKAAQTTAAKKANQDKRKEALQRELEKLIKDSDALMHEASQQ